MKLEQMRQYGCYGRVKFSGYGVHGVSAYKEGGLFLYNDKGIWRLDLMYNVKKEPIRTFRLDQQSLLKVVCKGTLLINLKEDATHYSVYYQPLNGDFSSMKVMGDLIEDIMKGNTEPPSPCRAKLGITSQTSNGVSPSSQQFTSMKESKTPNEKFSKTRVSLFTEEPEENYNESIKRMKTEKSEYLERGLSKAQNNQDVSRSPSTFYKENNSRLFGSFGMSNSSVKRGPGLMPYPSQGKSRLHNSVPYSWARTKPVTEHAENNQQNFLGFSNLGNTCYMNAILQSLFSLDCFTFDVNSSSSKLLRSLPPTSLYNSLFKLLSSRKKSFSEVVRKEYLKNVKYAISQGAKRFLGYQQHDAHEFLGQVLDQLKEEVFMVNKSTPSPHRNNSENIEGKCPDILNPIIQNFEVEVEHTISCTRCGEKVKKSEQFNDISLEMPRRRNRNKSCTLQNALDLFFRKENLEYKCNKCECTKAEVTHKFTKLPRVLVLHLKRYSYCSSATFQVKMLQSICINKYLTLEPHCLESTRPPFPAVFPEEESPVRSVNRPDYSTPTVREDSSTPRRRLDLSSKFRFRKTRPSSYSSLNGSPSVEGPDTSTPYKRLKLSDSEADITKSSEKKADKVITVSDEDGESDIAKALELSMQGSKPKTQSSERNIDKVICQPNTLSDEDGDSDLAKALELSMQESKMKTQDIDEVDGGTQEDLDNALEQSRIEHEKSLHTDYCSEMQGMTEEEQLRLAIEASMREWEASSVRTEKEQLNLIVNDYESVNRSNCGSANRSNDKSGSYSCSEIRTQDHIYCSPKSSNVTSQHSVRKHLKEQNCQGNDDNDFNAVKNSAKCDFKQDVIKENLDERRPSVEYVGLINNSEDLSNKNASESIEENSNLKSVHGMKNIKTVNFSMSNLKDRLSPYKAAGIHAKSERNEVTNGNISHLKTETDMDSSGDFKTTPKQAVQLQMKDIDTSFVPKLSSTDFQLFSDEQFENDVSQLIDDWPDDKENKQPGVTLETNQDVVKDDSLYIDDLPHIENEKGDKPYSYKLVSIVNHIGSSSVAGHYVSDILNIRKQCWLSCDDSHVTNSSESEIRQRRERSGYIFFYLSKEVYQDIVDDYALAKGK